jgi:tetratricopeptide (TPR) repeat protein
MSRKLIYVLILLTFFIVQGCTLHRNFLCKPEPIRVTSESPLGKLDRARLLQRSEDYLGALVKYRDVIACGRDRREIVAAQIGGAECLLAIKKYPAALSILEPLPLNISVDTDVRKLALAGEILLHIGRSAEAEIYLEISVGALELESMLDQNNAAANKVMPIHGAEQNKVAEVGIGVGSVVGDIEMESWIPAMVVNLGCAYLKNDKPEHALVMYQFASYLYQQNGNHILAARSMRMYDDLVSVIRQYEPFKPLPIAKGFSSGRK